MLLDDCLEIPMTPFLYLKSNEHKQVLPLLDQHNIYYTLDKFFYPNYGAAQFPISPRQLSQMDSIVYLPELQHPAADKILETHPLIAPSTEPTMTDDAPEKINWKILLPVLFFVALIAILPLDTFFPSLANSGWYIPHKCAGLLCIF